MILHQVKANTLLILFFCGSLVFNGLSARESTERIIPFEYDWYFRLEKTNDNPNEQPEWRKVDIPHDWSVEQPFVKTPEGGISTGHKKGGMGWYLKKFSLSNIDTNKIITLCFDGVYMEAEIWMNNKKIYYHPNGYTPFRCDITDYCNSPGAENELKIKVINQGRNSRWYSGSGIYRHVWILKTEKVHLDTWNTFISTEKVTGDKAYINISTDLLNTTNKKIRGGLVFKIYDNSGKQILLSKSELISSANEKNNIIQKVIIQRPQLWYPEFPAMYKVKIYSVIAGRITDSVSVPFGIRIIAFSTKNGFQLNGQTLKLRGGCIHHDNGLLGAAAIDRAEERKVELLKTNGFNAVRCAHNPPSEQFLNACDRLGLLVIDEAFDQWQKPKNPNDYHRFFNEWSIPDVESMVRRDRNHPSIIMWSIGNEIEERADSSGMFLAQKLKKAIKDLDATRPVTAAVNEFWDNPQLKWNDSECAFRYLDLSGYNYMWWEYENDHKLDPNRVIYGSESTAMERAINWDLVEKSSYIIGDFVWTAIDYLGESGIGNTGYYAENEKKTPQFMDYPWFNGWCGDIDICGNTKPQSLFRDVVWGTSNIEMVVHAPIPNGQKEKVSYWGWPDEEAHWNWTGFENKILDVRVFTRYQAVRLYLNDRLLDEKKCSNDKKNKYTVTFQIPYQSGTLKAVGIQNEKTADTTLLKTTGKAAGIHLKADRNKIEASKNDLAYVLIELIDNKGNNVPDEDVEIALKITGNGKVIAGNACPNDMKSFRSLHPFTFKGKALAIVQPTGKAGKVTLEVSSKTITTRSIDIYTY